MNILALDTSSKKFNAAISKDDRIRYACNLNLGRKLEKRIIPEIAKLLKKASLKIIDIDGFAVGLGPGSFTSLRIGLSVVKGFALATGAPVVGVGSLDAIAMAVPTQDDIICVLEDAKRDLLYSCFYKKNKMHLKQEGPYCLISLKELFKKFKGELTFVGDGICLYKKEIIDSAKKRYVPKFSEEKYWYPQARYIITNARDRFYKKQIDDPKSLTPIYLYPETCQIRK